MRKGLFFSSLAIATAAGAALYIYWYAPAARSIYGTLSSTTTKRPLRGCEVVLESRANPTFRQVRTTDERGWFNFADLEEGTYRVTAYNRDKTGSLAVEVPRGSKLALEATFRVDDEGK